ncbi:unnamed protein product [Closterium sp. NIES-53]
MCGDYRSLNKVTVADRYPMQSADEIFDKLQGATVFSTLDLRKGFNQIPIRPADSEARARCLRELLPAALENLHVAQLRDAQRYKKRGERQDGKKDQTLGVGEEVYLRQAKHDLMDLGLSTERWKVKEVKDSGVVVLMSAQGQRRTDHCTNVARARGRTMGQ